MAFIPSNEKYYLAVIPQSDKILAAIPQIVNNLAVIPQNNKK